jgi:phosphoglucomutase
MRAPIRPRLLCLLVIQGRLEYYARSHKDALFLATKQPKGGVRSYLQDLCLLDKVNAQLGVESDTAVEPDIKRQRVFNKDDSLLTPTKLESAVVKLEESLTRMLSIYCLLNSTVTSSIIARIASKSSRARVIQCTHSGP